MWKTQSVQVVLPAYNEDKNVRVAIEDFLVSEYVDEVIVIDNRSTDNTASEIKKTKAIYEYEDKLVTGSGYGSALTRGLKKTTADIVITCEPDGTFSAHDILKLLAYSDDFDVVFGTRTAKVCIWDGANMYWLLRMGNVLVAKMMEYFFNGPCLTDAGCTLKLIKRKVLDQIQPHFTVKKSHFQPEFMMLSMLHSRKVIEVPINYYERVGESKVTGSFKKTVSLGLVMIVFIIWYRLNTFFKFKRRAKNEV
ncbi:MAG: glycosyltransferase family 2 protein [Candidatus Margulisiibacteriota bacterium]